MKIMQVFTDKKAGNMRCYVDNNNVVFFERWGQLARLGIRNLRQRRQR